MRLKGVLADSDFYQKDFIELLENKNITYVISASMFKNLQQRIYCHKEWNEIDKGLCIGELMFHPNEWIKDRRYILIRQDTGKRHNATGKQLKLFGLDEDEKIYRYSVYITNSNENPYDVWKNIRQRSNDENKIKELKEDFALGGFCMNSFYATEVSMLIRMLACNLFKIFRNIVFGGNEKNQRLKTLRYKYFVIPAQLGRSGNTDIFRLSVHSQSMKSKIVYFFNKLLNFTPAFNFNCIAFQE